MCWVKCIQKETGARVAVHCITYIGPIKMAILFSGKDFWRVVSQSWIHSSRTTIVERGGGMNSREGRMPRQKQVPCPSLSSLGLVRFPFLKIPLFLASSTDSVCCVPTSMRGTPTIYIDVTSMRGDRRLFHSLSRRLARQIAKRRSSQCHDTHSRWSSEWKSITNWRQKSADLEIFVLEQRLIYASFPSLLAVYRSESEKVGAFTRQGMPLFWVSLVSISECKN